MHKSIGRLLEAYLKKTISTVFIVFSIGAASTANAINISPGFQTVNAECAVTGSGGPFSLSYSVTLSSAGSTPGVLCSSAPAPSGVWLSLSTNTNLGLVPATGSAYWRVYEDSDYELLRLTYQVASSSIVNLSLTRFLDYTYKPTSTNIVFNSGEVWNFIDQFAIIPNSSASVDSSFSFAFNFNTCNQSNWCLAPSPRPSEYFFSEGSAVAPVVDIQSIDPDPSTVPEPSTTHLILLAMVAAGFAKFRNKSV
jgi:hypothetical protein